MNSARGGLSGQGAGAHGPRHLADDAAQLVPSADNAVVRRTKDGWRVGGADLPDLTSAMVLADLLAAELATPAAAEQARGGQAGQPTEASETNRLRATIGQLEHALMARVRVEQAIGVLAERHRIQPRQAFEQLRHAARSRGRRVIDIASDVVASATNPLLQLPDELSRPRPPARPSGPAASRHPWQRVTSD
jgi:ANTAR domain